MVTFDEAAAIIAQHALPLGTEAVALANAAGRVLAEPVVALVDSPPRAVAAMDGYAIGDVPRTEYRVIGTVAPAMAEAGFIDSNECVRIYTGAPIPKGASQILMQEIVERDGEVIRLRCGVPANRHIRSRASDFAKGDILLAAGRRMTPQALVAAAAADVDCLSLWRRLRVALLSTGDELAEPGSARSTPGAIPDSLSYSLSAMIAQWGGVLISSARIGDDLAVLSAAARDASATADLIVVTGGASMGDKDFAKAAFVPLPCDLHFDKIDIRPGKPVWFGKVGCTLVLGLPGYPVSAFVTARLLLAPLVAGLSGLGVNSAWNWRRGKTETAIDATSRETFFCSIRSEVGGKVQLVQNASSQRLLADSNCLIRVRAGEHRNAGELVELLDF